MKANNHPSKINFSNLSHSIDDESQFEAEWSNFWVSKVKVNDKTEEAKETVKI